MGTGTNAIWIDVDKDCWPNLNVVDEWMPITILRNNKGYSYGMETSLGWWTSIIEFDLNSDGIMEFLLSNLGRNNQFVFLFKSQ